MRFSFLVLPLALLLAAACSSGADDSGRLRVVATTTQIGDFTRNVAADNISLTVLLKPNQDAHDFEPEPSQIRALADADLILRNGVGLDAFVSKSAEGTKARVVIVSDGIDLREGGEEHEEEHEDEHEEDEAAHEEAGGNDPHIWFSVSNARQMVENIRDALVDADAANATAYRDNATRYLGSLDGLDREIRAEVATIPARCRKLVTNHDVLGYYADAYGFTVVGSVLESLSTDAQPSASDVVDIVARIRTERVPAIFAETSNNPAVIRQVGREANVTVIDDLYGDSLGAKGSDGETYVAMMQTNTKKIASALKSCSA